MNIYWDFILLYELNERKICKMRIALTPITNVILGYRETKKVNLELCG